MKKPFLKVRIISAIIFCVIFSIISLVNAGEYGRGLIPPAFIITCLFIHLVFSKKLCVLTANAVVLIGVFDLLRFTSSANVISFGFPKLYLMIFYQQESLILFTVLSILLFDSLQIDIKIILKLLKSKNNESSNYYIEKFESKNDNELREIINSPIMAKESIEAAETLLKNRKDDN